MVQLVPKEASLFSSARVGDLLGRLRNLYCYCPLLSSQKKPVGSKLKILLWEEAEVYS